jgi:hypothetical protein
MPVQLSRLPGSRHLSPAGHGLREANLARDVALLIRALRIGSFRAFICQRLATYAPPLPLPPVPATQAGPRSNLSVRRVIGLSTCLRCNRATVLPDYCVRRTLQRNSHCSKRGTRSLAPFAPSSKRGSELCTIPLAGRYRLGIQPPAHPIARYSRV